MSRILIVEDEPDMREGLRVNLEYEGHEVELAADGDEGFEKARRGQADLILLDIMLPGADGFEVLRRLRRDGVTTPVLMLTARGLETDKVQGLTLGADDYVTKPFSIRELVARIEAILRRSRATAEAGAGDRLARFVFADVEIDFQSRTVTKAGAPVGLSYKEFELLRLLVEAGGDIVSRAAVLEAVWGFSEHALPATRTVDTHIANLRKKIEGDRERGRYIRTVHKVGYRFVEDGE